ncbi:MAG: hypothetical protein QNJ36_12970 [Calothrix sp. MO_167.B42]|nr:hypothetical protein [Calothrix sp. MO_167.B42]
MVGWGATALRGFPALWQVALEQSETQQRIDNVGFRPSTQPTPALVFMLNNNGIAPTPTHLSHSFSKWY